MSFEYGHCLRHHFYLEEGYVNLNHGSFGTVPKPVMEHQIKLLAKQEAKPDAWFRVSLCKQTMLC